ncbi:MAG TPA: hypothetical protein VEP50_20915 [bacterium]|nr:hypothetical protein [bacterium]
MVEQSPRTAIVTIGDVVPDVFVALNGAEITIPNEAMTFLVTQNSSDAPIPGASHMTHRLGRARGADVPALAIERSVTPPMRRTRSVLREQNEPTVAGAGYVARTAAAFVG